MKRFRIGTLMLLIAIVALCAALVAHERRAARREAALKAKLERQKYQLIEAQLDRLARRDPEFQDPVKKAKSLLKKMVEARQAENDAALDR